MKKRRELDALAGKAGRRKKGQHELLMNDSESSEIEEFALPQKLTLRKQSRGCQGCSKFVPMCGLVLLLGCMTAVVFLTWLHIQMRQDMEHLRQQIDAVKGTNKDTPQILTEVQNNLQQNTKTILALQKNVTWLMSEVSLLNISTSVLNKSVKAAPLLKSLPDKVGTLSQNLADFGSKVSNFQGQLDDIDKGLKDLEEKVTAFTKSDVQTTAPSTPHEQLMIDTKINETSPALLALQNYVSQHVSKLTDDITNINDTLSSIPRSIQAFENKLVILKNVTTLMGTKLASIEGHVRENERIPALVHSDVQAQIGNLTRLIDEKATTADLNEMRIKFEGYRDATDTRLSNLEQVDNDEERDKEDPLTADGFKKVSTTSVPEEGEENGEQEGNADEAVQSRTTTAAAESESDAVTDQSMLNSEEHEETGSDTDKVAASFTNTSDVLLMFDKLDLGKKGFLTPEEISPLNVDLNLVDVDHNDQVSLEEFTNYFSEAQTRNFDETVEDKDMGISHDNTNDDADADSIDDADNPGDSGKESADEAENADDVVDELLKDLTNTDNSG